LRLLASEEASHTLAQRLFQETGGQPYFLAEVLRTIAQEAGTVHNLAGQWHLPANLDEAWLLPPSVRAASLSRLDRLPPEDRELLDQASVAGGEFSPFLMSKLLNRSEPSVAALAERLSARGFLRPRPPDRYAFGHDLMRRAAYEALSEPRRRLLHRLLAAALQTVGSAPDAIASHYAASDWPWLALEPALEAASRAAHLVAYDEALAWCQQAREIAEAHPHAVPVGYRTRLHLQWRALWYYRGDLERTIAAGQAALAAARREGDASAQLSALWHLAHDETQVTAATRSGLQLEALALARHLGDRAALAGSLARLGSDTGFVARPAERAPALEALDQAVSLARQCADPPLLHRVLCELWGVGRLPVARVALEEALDLVRQLGHRQEEVGTLAKLSDLLARQGDLAAAVACARQGLDLARQLDSPAYGAWNQRSLGQALVSQGDTAQGLTCLQQSAQTFEAHAWRAMLAGTLLRQGLALQVAGDGERAMVILERVVALSQETRELYESAYALAALGELRCVAGQVRSGADALEQAFALTTQVGLPWHRAGTLVHLASGWLLLDQAELAVAAAEEAVHLAEEEDLRELWAHALWLRGRALQALGDAEGAQQFLVAGLEQAKAIGQVWLEQHLVMDLQELCQP
jgi:tetratricopeptide (TPR) repeat protein